MNRRIFIRECDGWRQKNVEYKTEGSDTIGICSKSEWRLYEIKYYLAVTKGISESLLEEIYDIGYRQGSLDENDSNAGEGL